MLLDINDPKSRAILTAARHLDALHLAWQMEGSTPPHELEEHVTRLRELAKAHFPELKNIENWLTELSEVLSLWPALRPSAKAAYLELISKLEGDKGFQTTYI